MHKILHKKLNERLMLAGMFAFVALGALYLYLTYTSKEVNPDSYINPTPTTILGMPSEEVVNGMKKYRSDNMKIEFEYPAKYKLTEQLNTVTLEQTDGVKSEILVSVYGTNFNNVSDHINNVISKKKLVPAERAPFSGRYFDGEYTKYVEKNLEYESYYYVRNNTVYQIFTSSPILYGDVKRLAESLIF
ncbi:MAG: hypothetical protein U0525_01335 [Patescibacteria group bacterium]